MSSSDRVVIKPCLKTTFFLPYLKNPKFKSIIITVISQIFKEEKCNANISCRHWQLNQGLCKLEVPPPPPPHNIFQGCIILKSFGWHGRISFCKKRS